jgi:hypothetical protein
VELGKVYARQGRHSEAEGVFATAQTIVHELTANVPDEALRANFLEQATAMIAAQRAQT